MPHSDPDARRAYQRRYYALNREKLLETSRPRSAENQRRRRARAGESINARRRERYSTDLEVRERIKAQVADYYKRNPEKMRERNQRDYERNGEARRARAREWHDANRDRSIANMLWRRHRLRPDAVAAMYEAQDGRCYLCRDPMDPDRAFMDHDHRCSCGVHFTCPVCRRGLVHPNCNTAIGLAGDDPERLRRMADALEAAQLAVTKRLAAADKQLTLGLEA